VTLHGDQVQLSLCHEVSALAMPVPLCTEVTKILTDQGCAPAALAHPDTPNQRIILTGERYGVPLPWPPLSGFAGFRLPPEVIMVAVRWYLRYGLSYRDVEELLTERGIAVDHVTVYRWVQRFTPLLIDAA
jgi:hypothetical protein